MMEPQDAIVHQISIPWMGKRRNSKCSSSSNSEDDNRSDRTLAWVFMQNENETNSSRASTAASLSCRSPRKYREILSDIMGISPRNGCSILATAAERAAELEYYARGDEDDESDDVEESEEESEDEKNDNPQLQALRSEWLSRERNMNKFDVTECEKESENSQIDKEGTAPLEPLTTCEKEFGIAEPTDEQKVFENDLCISVRLHEKFYCADQLTSPWREPLSYPEKDVEKIFTHARDLEQYHAFLRNGFLPDAIRCLLNLRQLRDDIATSGNTIDLDVHKATAMKIYKNYLKVNAPARIRMPPGLGLGLSYILFPNKAYSSGMKVNSLSGAIEPIISYIHDGLNLRHFYAFKIDQSIQDHVFSIKGKKLQKSMTLEECLRDAELTAIFAKYLAEKASLVGSAFILTKFRVHIMHLKHRARFTRESMYIANKYLGKRSVLRNFVHPPLIDYAHCVLSDPSSSRADVYKSLEKILTIVDSIHYHVLIPRFREFVYITGVKETSFNKTCAQNCSSSPATSTVTYNSTVIPQLVNVSELSDISLTDNALCTFERAVGRNMEECRQLIQLELQRRAQGLTWDSAINLMADAIMTAQWTLTSNSGRRLSAVACFDTLNALLRDVVFQIPDQSINAGSGLTIGIRKLKCGSLRIGDLEVTSRRRGNTEVDATIRIESLRVMCNMDYSWDWWIFGGGGQASGGGPNNHMSTSLTFQSTNLDLNLPHATNVGNCAATINIDTLNLSGGITSSILSLFKSSLKSYISGKLREVVCDELGSLGSTTLTDLLASLTTRAEPYLGALVVVDPLAPEKALQVPDDVKLVRWDQGDIMQLINMGIEDGLGKVSNSTNADGTISSDLGVNFAVKALLGGTGTLHIPFNETEGTLYSGHDPLTETTIRIVNVSVTGLDTFTEFDPMNAIGNYTLHHRLALSKLSAVAYMSISMKPSSLSSTIIHTGSGEIVETIKITTSLDNVALETSTLIALDENKLRDLQIGSLMANPLECALSSIYLSNVTSLKLTIGNIENPQLDGFIDCGLDNFFTSLSDALFLMCEKVALKALPNVMELMVRDQVNNGLASFINSNNQGCQPVNINPFPSYFNFHTDPLFQKVKTMINDFLVVNTSTSEKNGINGVLIGPLTKAQSGTPGAISYPGTIFRMNYTEQKHASFGYVDFHLRDMMMTGLDTFYNMSLLQTVASEPHHLNNDFGFAHPEPFAFMVDMLIRIEEGKPEYGSNGQPITMYNDFRLELDIYKFIANLKLLLKINTYLFDAMTLNQITTFECWVATIPVDGFQIEHLLLLFERFGLHLKCRNCTSPGFVEVEKRLQWNETKAQFTHGVNSIIKELTDFASGDIMQSEINNVLEGAPEACKAKTSIAPPPPPPSNSTPTKKSGKPTSFYILIGAVGLMVCLGLAVLGWIVRQYFSQQRLLRYQKQIDSGRNKEKHVSPLIKETTSLFLSANAIPTLVRYSIPVILLINCGFFLSGHLSLGATVDIRLQLAGENITISSFFTFSMAQSTIDMWKAGAYPLAVLIIIFSGLWPYIKMFMMIFLWFAPPTWCAPSSRGTMFLWLDVLGKWSMIDIFVLVMSMIAFRLRIVSPETFLALPPNFYVVDLIVVPVWGLYANIIAQLLSQLVSHVVIYYHRNVISAAEEETGERLGNLNYALRSLRYEKGHMQSIAENREYEMTKVVGNIKKSKSRVGKFLSRLQISNAPGRRHRATTWLQAGTQDVSGPRRMLVNHRESLYAHIYNIDGIIHRIQVRILGTALLLSSLATTMVLIYYGAGLKSFKMQINGLAGLAMDLGRANSSISEYSVFDVSSNIASQANPKSFWSILGINYIAFIFVLCALVVPLLQMAGLFIMWLAPLTLYELKIAFMVNEIFAAWQYLEVYLIAISVAVLQMGQVSGFMVGSECDAIQPMLDSMVNLNVIEKTDGTCFYVDASVRYGTWILLAASIMLNISTQFVVRAAETALEDREARIKGALLLNADQHRAWIFRSFLLFLKTLRLVKFINPTDDEDCVNGLGHKTRRDTHDMHWKRENRTASESSVRRSRQKSDQELPEHWQELETPDGEIYYWNTLTGKTQWEVPVSGGSGRLKSVGTPIV
eukprot:g1989.t1